MNGTLPFSAPPGLEAPELDAATFATVASTANSEVRPMTLEAVEDKLKELGPEASREAILEAIREVVLAEVEHKVQEKTGELLSKGKQVVATMQQRQKERNQQLLEELAQCRQKQQELETENTRLKQVLVSLSTSFTMMNAGYPPKDPTRKSPDAAASTVAGASPLQTEDTPSQLFTPGPFTPQAFTPSSELTGGDAKLPDVPAFPFPSAPSSGPPPSPGFAASAAPISLAESLGQKTPQRTPVSLVNSLLATPTPEMPSPFTINGRAPGTSAGLVGGCGIFSFTLRKADGAELGLNVSHHEDDQVLRVEGVRPDGAVEAWNRQCVGTAFAEKAILPGDRIMSVNQVAYDPVKMLQECKDKQLLKLTVARGNVALPAAPAAPPSAAIAALLASPGKHELRADASVFVPNISSDAPSTASPTASNGNAAAAKDDAATSSSEK